MDLTDYARTRGALHKPSFRDWLDQHPHIEQEIVDARNQTLAPTWQVIVDWLAEHHQIETSETTIRKTFGRR